MKKTRVLALVVCAAVMLMGVGYALWSEDITVTTSASMGKVDVTILGDHNKVEALTQMCAVDGKYEYMELAPPTSNKSSITAHLSNLYPNAKYRISFKIKNTGDFPVKLAAATFSPELTPGGASFYDQLKGSITMNHVRPGITNPLAAVVTGIRSFANLGSAIVSAASNIVLMPGDEIFVGWGNGDTSEDAFTVVVPNFEGGAYEGASAGFSLTFNWQQCAPEAAEIELADWQDFNK